MTGKARLAEGPDKQNRSATKAAPAAEREGGETDVKPDFARAHELQYLAPENYKMPPPEPSLLASANHMLRGRLKDLEAERDELARQYAAAEQKRVETTAELTATMQSLDAIREHLAPFSGDIDPSDRTEVELAALAAKTIGIALDTVESVARGDEPIDVLDAASGYLIKVPKRKPRIVTSQQTARNATLAAVRNGAGRADVYALVPLGSARRGVEWNDTK